MTSERFIHPITGPANYSHSSPESRAPSPQALKFVIHFVGDLHQPLHDEDNGDEGGNTRDSTGVTRGRSLGKRSEGRENPIAGRLASWVGLGMYATLAMSMPLQHFVHAQDRTVIPELKPEKQVAQSWSLTLRLL